MSTPLPSLKTPLGIRPDHISPSTITLRVRQKCLTWSSGNFTLTSASNPSSPIFSVDAKPGSWSQKRAVRDASGLPLLDIRRKSMGATWYVELPGSPSGSKARSSPLVTLAPRQSENCKDKMDVYVQNVARDGVEVKLSVQGVDIWKRKTNVYVDDAVVMEGKYVNLVSAYNPYLKDNEWEVRVAEGMDASIALAIIVVLAANLYDSSLLTTGSEIQSNSKA